MDNRFVASVTVLLVVGGLAGCSSPAAERLPPGALPAGTAEISINGTGMGRTDAVSCTTIGPVTTIKTGDDDAGTLSSVDNAKGLAVQFTRITNLGGFTGGYWADLGTPAKVEMTNRTFLMTGSAMGFNTDNPSFRTSGDFSIRVAC